MSGILIYSELEAKRNAFAIEKFKNNLGVTLVNEDYDENADFVINRTDNAAIGKKFEDKGIRVFNPSSFSAISNDKQATYDFMEQNGIEIMPTRLTSAPAVVKPRNGKGGADVRLILQGHLPQDDSLVCQAVASDKGKDLRVFVIGGKIITAALRQSDSDFRSNYCLGGNATLYQLNKSEKSLVNKIISLIDGDYYGIDFVFNNGKIVFNELEDAVGARMVYALTNIDIITMYCNYINDMIK